MNKGVALTLGTALISGVSIFINAFGIKEISPDIFTFSKNIMVALFLVATLIAIGKWKEIKGLKAKDWKLLAAIGLVGGSVPFVLFFRGLQMTSAANSSFIQKTMFLFVAAFALYFLKEDVKRYALPGVALLAGNFLLLNMTGFKFASGDIYILAATLFWAAENVISKKAVHHISGTVVAAARMGIGAVALFAYILASGQAGSLLSLSGAQAGWILITAAFLVGYVATWYNGIMHIPITLATVILQIGAPVTILLNWAFLGKEILLVQGAGMILIAASVAYLATQYWKSPISEKALA